MDVVCVLGRILGWEWETILNSPSPLLQHLRNQNIVMLHDACIGFPQPRGHLGWKDAITLGLPEALAEEWENYIGLLCENFISLDEELDDTLCWSKNPKDMKPSQPN
jgi:hypothetical protein